MLNKRKQQQQQQLGPFRYKKINQRGRKQCCFGWAQQMWAEREE